jgi:hypothetical protein
VDRIFSVVPALCLLLAAQLKAINIARLRALAAFTIILAAIFIAAYSGMRMIDGYRNNRDALVKFGREVRRIAAAEHLRYEIVPARDQGLLLYLQRPRFSASRPLGVTLWSFRWTRNSGVRIVFLAVSQWKRPETSPPAMDSWRRCPSQIDSTFANNALLSLAGGVPKSRARNFVGAVAL